MTIITKSAVELSEDDFTPADIKFQLADDETIKKELQLNEVPDYLVAGWASTSDLDTMGHVVENGAFAEAIKNRGLVGNRGIRLLREHRWSQVSGVIKQLAYQTDGRLWIAAQINPKLAYAAEIFEVCKMTGGLNFSVGFYLQDYSWKTDKQNNEYLSITRGDLFEVSIVPFPANEKATMQVVKSRENRDETSSLAEFEKALVAEGLAKSRNDAQRITLAVKKHSHLFKTGSDTSDDSSAPLLATGLLKDVSAKLEAFQKALGRSSV